MTRKVVNLTRIIIKLRGDEMPLYNRLKEYRAKIGVNQQQMGKMAGVSRQTISQIERGDYSPSVTLALKIAKVFDARVEDIFWYEEEDENE
ncbi:transcriptional regulator [Anaerostipes butyraticus]|uniref:Transcriptional regulator n=2 Tax=Lachnospiraceae TaxID=186803 RepID=A0A916Q4R9_9FIRM|nr:transcriptional regulator [Anaerostipes butyraticus]